MLLKDLFLTYIFVVQVHSKCGPIVHNLLIMPPIIFTSVHPSQLEGETNQTSPMKPGTVWVLLKWQDGREDSDSPLIENVLQPFCNFHMHMQTDLSVWATTITIQVLGHPQNLIINF